MCVHVHDSVCTHVILCVCMHACVRVCVCVCVCVHICVLFVSLFVCHSVLSTYKEWGSLRSPTPCVCMHFTCVSTAWKVIAGHTL